MSRFIRRANGEDWLDANGENLSVAPITQSVGGHKTTLPLAIVQEAYKEYSDQYGDGQSLERLNERGGFGSAEVAILLYERIKRLERIMRNPPPPYPEELK